LVCGNQGQNNQLCTVQGGNNIGSGPCCGCDRLKCQNACN
jgi:hypothetical protein